MTSRQALVGALLVGFVAAQNASTPTYTFPSGYTSASFNLSLQPTPFTRTDFSESALLDLWDSVGPIATGPVTSTVSPTPEPSLAAWPQPNADFFHGLVTSSYPQLANVKLPAGFKWGVSSSAFQIEGAAKAEGKGPSIWDLLSHRVPNEVADNSTADVVASHYYLYKQDYARLKAFGIPCKSSREA